ncbi:hypothetical protein AABB24_038642 [Solanum stoloniferum]|uniref:Probable magnesium transporter n=1 Tax=Solanum stoloniferum TaxID=62892 RepID=A0ABD2QYK0_9SOLN
MVFSKDNMTGIILALLSSVFIGASFIIKKKGLRRAAVVSGVRAGVGGYSYLLEPLWWIGMITNFSCLLSFAFHSDSRRDCKFCGICFCSGGSCHPSGCIEYNCQCCIGSDYFEGKVASAWSFGMCAVHYWFCCYSCPCTTGASYLFCQRNLVYGNSESIFALHGIGDCVGFHSCLLLCSSMWTLKCPCFHWNLLIDGFSLGYEC